MTGEVIQLMIPGMARPGRRITTPSDYRLGFIQRTREARERAQLSQEEMAKELSRRAGRLVVPDTYRKYEKEDPKKGAMLPHDLISHFCEITRINPLFLLEASPLYSRVNTVLQRRSGRSGTNG